MTNIPASSSATTTAPFSETQIATLNVLMDFFIPASADGRMPSAKSLSLYADISTLPARDRALIESGLADIDVRATRQHGQRFTQLEGDDALALVTALRSERAPFIQAFMTQTAGRYLANETVMPLIGLEPRPLWPKGNVVKDGDWSLIDVVRKRPKLYRNV